MAASRFLAPYFGTSSIVWANVIGVILLALAVGYHVGGRLADRYPSRQVFFGCGALGAVILAFLPFVSALVLQPLGQGLLQTPGGLVLATFVASLLLFGVPVFFFAMLSPFAVRLLSSDLAVVGSRSGSLSFWSTLGSILGIYITSLYLVPLVGVRESIWLFSALLLIPSLFFLPRRLPLTALVLLVFGTTVLVAPVPQSFAAGKVLHTQESTYQFLRVLEDAAGTRLLSFNEGQGVQSMYTPGKIWTEAYYDYAAPLPLLERFAGKSELKVLILGYAGGTVGKILRAGAPASMRVEIDAVEIDPVVSDLSTRYFGVTPEERQLFTMDGRSFVQLTEKTYDLVIIDAYSQEIYIPPHMMTQEFFGEVRSRLTPEGVVAFNINVLSTEGRLFQSALATVQSAGFTVYDVPVPRAYNRWILASATPLAPEFVALEDARVREIAAYVTSTMSGLQAQAGATVMTDNRSPVEFFIHEEIWKGLWGQG